jgi:hypothetical protein
LKTKAGGGELQLQLTNHQLQIEKGFGTAKAVRKRFGYLEAGVARLRFGVVWRRDEAWTHWKPGDAITKSQI